MLLNFNFQFLILAMKLKKLQFYIKINTMPRLSLTLLVFIAMLSVASCGAPEIIAQLDQKSQ
jgi:hypothetical protein